MGVQTAKPTRLSLKLHHSVQECVELSTEGDLLWQIVSRPAGDGDWKRTIVEWTKQ